MHIYDSKVNSIESFSTHHAKFPHLVNWAQIKWFNSHRGTSKMKMLTLKNSLENLIHKKHGSFVGSHIPGNASNQYGIHLTTSLLQECDP